MSNSAASVGNSIIGAILTSLGISLFVAVHNHRLNISDVLWAMTSFRQKWLPQYFPLIAGIFLTTGILFDCLQYGSFNQFQPFGPQQQILARTSMYGFALSGFCVGLGSKLAEGDVIYHGLIGVAMKSRRSLLVLVVVLVSAGLWSWLLDGEYVGFFSNTEVNPLLEFMHMESANINIGLACLLLIISFCWLKAKQQNINSVASKIGASFLSGVLLALGFSLCGISRRTVVFACLTPGPRWNPALLIFIMATIGLNLVTYHLVFRKLLWRDNVGELVVLEEKGEAIGLQVVLGSILMGSGWGIGGVDLTAYFIHSAIFSIPVVVIFGVFLILGTMIGDNFQ